MQRESVCLEVSNRWQLRRGGVEVLRSAEPAVSTYEVMSQSGMNETFVTFCTFWNGGSVLWNRTLCHFPLPLLDVVFSKKNLDITLDSLFLSRNGEQRYDFAVEEK